MGDPGGLSIRSLFVLPLLLLLAELILLGFGLFIGDNSRLELTPALPVVVVVVVFPLNRLFPLRRAKLRFGVQLM